MAMPESIKTGPRSKIEKKELIFTSDPNPLFEGYFDEVRNRVFRPRTSEDVAQLVALELSAPPLTALTDEEFKKLERYLEADASFQADHGLNAIYRVLAERPVYFIDEELAQKINIKIIRPTLLDSTSSVPSHLESIQALKDLQIVPLNPEGLVSLISNPTIIDNLRYIGEEGGRPRDTVLIGPGSRSLYHKRHPGSSLRDDYGYKSPEAFKEKLARVKKRMSKKSLRILDIGGNTGRALLDAKDIDPSLVTMNMTLSSEAAIAGDVVVRRPAEYMPAVFEEKVDIIESNVAFRYFLYPDIALRNAIKALAVGGETNIHFSTDSCPLDKEELFERMKKVFSWLKELKDKGYIEIDAKKSGFILVDNPYVNEVLELTKKKSTVGL